MKKRSLQLKSSNGAVFPVIKSSLIALAVSLISILIFAFIIRFIQIGDGAIKPINQVIKGISILLGCLIGLKKVNKMGLVKGLIIGLLYTVISFFVFSILDGNFSISKTILNDLLFSGIFGAICGIIVVNVRKK